MATPMVAVPDDVSSVLHRPDAGAALPAVPACTAFAAVRITSITRSGWESMGTWLLSSSYVVAAIRLAKKRSRSGCTVWSFFPTMYQLGFDFQAVPPTFASNRSGRGTPWVAQTSFKRADHHAGKSLPTDQLKALLQLPHPESVSRLGSS